ncbi:hypothetical protein AX17_002033 [Amanita inopinata Kibby_2008]|nr:hypothetical protein AX17_002033 [Amanita inopinata Kibby_2008]
MLQFMNVLTDKPDWHKKVFNEEIANKWKNEILETEDIDITQAMVDWCIEELRYKAKIFENTGTVTVYDANVVKSDIAVPQEIKEALKNAVHPLENVPPARKDWHPGSDEKVLDLVHPSLFPLIYGRSRILPNDTMKLDDCIQRCGEGITLPAITVKDGMRSYNLGQERKKMFSKKFQWLPCDVNVAGDNVQIISYINNLHPHRYKNLYSVIEKIIACAIPLWNVTLTRQKVPEYCSRRIIYKEAIPEGDDVPEPEQEEDEDDANFDERYEAWGEDHMNRPALQPEPETFEPPTVPDGMRDTFMEEDGLSLKHEHVVDLKRDYGECGLQVIVKLANIHLTPEKPEYEGGTWHVEGQLNEHICATALYYYDTENISTSSLGFCQQSSTDDAHNVNYEQNYNRWIEDVFGCESWGPAVQDIGTVDTKEGRLLTFPNILQHQVQKFQLADPTKPGHRKILALFLVDPNIRIISTANVPCQRLDWWREAVREKNTGMERLPLEVKDQVYEKVVDFPISMEEAKELRLELMEERKHFVVRQSEAFALQTFALCEH